MRLAEIKSEQNQAEQYTSTLSHIIQNFYLAVLVFASLTIEVSTLQNAQDLSIYDNHHRYKGEKIFFLLHFRHFS